jgi:hypothetical protein
MGLVSVFAQGVVATYLLGLHPCLRMSILFHTHISSHLYMRLRLLCMSPMLSDQYWPIVPRACSPWHLRLVCQSYRFAALADLCDGVSPLCFAPAAGLRSSSSSGWAYLGNSRRFADRALSVGPVLKWTKPSPGNSWRLRASFSRVPPVQRFEALSRLFRGDIPF